MFVAAVILSSRQTNTKRNRSSVNALQLRDERLVVATPAWRFSQEVPSTPESKTSRKQQPEKKKRPRRVKRARTESSGPPQWP
jgi:hypothetical protein